MKAHYPAALLLLAIMMTTFFPSNAQRNRGNKTVSTIYNKKPVDSSNNATAVQFDPYAGKRFVMIQNTGGFSDTNVNPLKKDGFLEKQADFRIPLPYENMRSDDALFVERVWREIDVREKINQVFRYQSEGKNGDQRFISILVGAIRDSLKTGRSI